MSAREFLVLTSHFVVGLAIGTLLASLIGVMAFIIWSLLS